MGSFERVLSFIPMAQTGLGFLDDRSAEDQAIAQLQARQDENLRQLEQNAALDRATLAAQSKQAEQNRLAALRRAVARQRAQFGGQGIGVEGGSQNAVMLGLFDESEDEREQREKMDALRENAINQNLEQQRSLNVLQREQLRQRQKLGRTRSWLDLAGGVLF
ncbi:MAG: transporter [Alphaproteobacteria bacterium]|nr:transporter [Alphaproteobacteria bacterium]